MKFHRARHRHDTTNARRTPSSPSARAISSDYTLIIDANNLCGRSGRVRERTEQIEDGPRPQFTACRYRISSRRVYRGSENKTYARALYAAGNAVRWKIDAGTQLLEHIRGTAARANRAVAVLCDTDACARNYKGRNCRYVESPRPIAAGSTSIDKSCRPQLDGLTGKSVLRGAASRLRSPQFRPAFQFLREGRGAEFTICAFVARPERTSSMSLFSLLAGQIRFRGDF